MKNKKNMKFNIWKVIKIPALLFITTFSTYGYAEGVWWTWRAGWDANHTFTLREPSGDDYFSNTWAELADSTALEGSFISGNPDIDTWRICDATKGLLGESALSIYENRAGYPNNAKLVNSDLWLNECDPRWSANTFVRLAQYQKTIMHELSHSVGMDHVTWTGEIMQSGVFTCTVDVECPSPGVILGINDWYQSGFALAEEPESISTPFFFRKKLISLHADFARGSRARNIAELADNADVVIEGTVTELSPTRSEHYVARNVDPVTGEFIYMTIPQKKWTQLAIVDIKKLIKGNAAEVGTKISVEQASNVVEGFLVDYEGLELLKKGDKVVLFLVKELDHLGDFTNEYRVLDLYDGLFKIEDRRVVSSRNNINGKVKRQRSKSKRYKFRGASKRLVSAIENLSFDADRINDLEQAVQTFKVKGLDKQLKVAIRSFRFTKEGILALKSAVAKSDYSNVNNKITESFLTIPFDALLAMANTIENEEFISDELMGDFDVDYFEGDDFVRNIEANLYY